MGLCLCSEDRTRHILYAKDLRESSSEKSNEDFVVDHNSHPVLADQPLATSNNKEEKDEECFISHTSYGNSERKPSIDSTEDEKQITINTGVAEKKFIFTSPRKNNGDFEFRPSSGSDWISEAAEGIDYRLLCKSPLKSLPDLKNVEVRKQFSGAPRGRGTSVERRDDESEMIQILSKVLRKKECNPSHHLIEDETSDSYSSSHT